MQEPGWAKWLRFGILLLATAAFLWDGGFPDILTALLWGPFLLYLLFIRGEVATVVVGTLLVTVAAYAYMWATTGDASTLALNILWLPFIGYPLVLITGLARRRRR